MKKIQTSVFLCSCRPRTKALQSVSTTVELFCTSNSDLTFIAYQHTHTHTHTHPQLLCHCRAEPLSVVQSPPLPEVIGTKRSSLIEMAVTHKVVFVDSPKNHKDDYTPKLVPFTAVSKVCYIIPQLLSCVPV